MNNIIHTRTAKMLQTTGYSKKIFSIDPGNIISGVCVIEHGKISYASNINSEAVFWDVLNEWEKKKNRNIVVVIEDIGPYQVRLSQQTIDTCKFIGELEYRLKAAGLQYEKVLRWEVKRWVYTAFKEVAEPRVIAKISKIKKKTRSGEDRKPSFVYVDDRIVIAAMKKLWDIPTPKPGKFNQHGLKSHSWQALAVGSFFLLNKC